MLKKAEFPGAAANKAAARCIALQRGVDILGVILLEPQTELHTRKASLYVKPGDDDEYVADALLGWLRREIIGIRRKSAGMFLKMELTPYMGANATRRALLFHGYTDTPPEKIYRKMHANQVVIRNRWKNFRSDLSRLCGIQLPVIMPNFHRHNQIIKMTSGAGVSLDKLEDYLSSVFILPGRDGVVIPIKKWFAEGFFDHSGQSHLFPASAELLGHKSYLGAPKKCMSVGVPLLFYQSAKKPAPGQIIAIARVVRARVIDTSKLSQAQKRHLVLTTGDINKLQNPALETVFDNCVILPSPVMLDDLRNMECVPPMRFRTAEPIDYKQMHKILKKGLAA